MVGNQLGSLGSDRKVLRGQRSPAIPTFTPASRLGLVARVLSKFSYTALALLSAS